MSVSTVHGRVLDRPGSENGIKLVAVQNPTGATGVDFFFNDLSSEYSFLSLKWRGMAFSTLTVADIIFARFSTGGTTFDAAGHYQFNSDTWYTTSTIGRIVGLGAAVSFSLDNTSTKIFQSATSALQKGINGFFDFDRGGASEPAGARWEIVAQGTSTQNIITFKGVGNWFGPGEVKGIQITNGVSTALIEGYFELWAYRARTPGVQW